MKSRAHPAPQQSTWKPAPSSRSATRMAYRCFRCAPSVIRPRQPFPAPPDVLFDMERQRTNFGRLLVYLLRTSLFDSGAVPIRSRDQTGPHEVDRRDRCVGSEVVGGSSLLPISGNGTLTASPTDSPPARCERAHRRCVDRFPESRVSPRARCDGLRARKFRRRLPREDRHKNSDPFYERTHFSTSITPGTDAPRFAPDRQFVRAEPCREFRKARAESSR